MKILARVVLAFAMLTVVLPVLGLIGARIGWWSSFIGLQGLILGLIVGVPTFVLAIVGHLIAIIASRNELHRKFGFGMVVGVCASTWVLFAAMSSSDYPFIVNISTDVMDPPQFIYASQLRGRDANPLLYTHQIAEIQQKAYPHIETYATKELSVEESFDLALEVATNMGWRITLQNRSEAHLEAVATTLIYRFQDDVVVRIRPKEGGNGSIVDLRSVSRVGLTDLGTNAKRIQTFLDIFDTSVRSRIDAAR